MRGCDYAIIWGCGSRTVITLCGAVILWQAYGFMILAQCERRNGKKLSTKYQQPQMTVWVLFFIENRLQTEGIAQFLPVKSW